MRKIEDLVLPSIPSDFKFLHINSGNVGNCYLTKDGKLFKEFYNSTDEYEMLKNISTYYDSKFLALPEKFIFLKRNKNELIGYIRDYIQGDTLLRLPNSVKMENFIQALYEFELDINKNAQIGLNYVDMHAGNIIYTPNNEFRIIDVDFFEQSYEEVKEVVREALYNLYYVFGSDMLNASKIVDPDINEIVLKSSSVGKKEYLRPSQMFEELIFKLEEKYLCNIETYKDFKDGLTLAKRR